MLTMVASGRTLWVCRTLPTMRGRHIGQGDISFCPSVILDAATLRSAAMVADLWREFGLVDSCCGRFILLGLGGQ